MKPIIGPTALASLQGIAGRGRQTDVVVLRPVFGSDEKGDDATDPEPSTVWSGKGWLSSSPTAQPTLDGGARIVTSNTYQLGLPVDADIKPRDFVDIGGQRYVVSDTTSDETWPIELGVSLRLAE